ncbi:MAG: hypothetical protein GY874_07625 [Desulfobacteraceae bacterium]|nr:hypothetical protein [Desulfobacteraceae bacterium]
MKGYDVTLEIYNGNRLLADCACVIIVPEPALTEPGHIRCKAREQTGQSKHEFHALGQMALYQYEDGDYTPGQINGKLQIVKAGESMILEKGMVICRTAAGNLTVLSNSSGNPRKLLEAANRYCTRWVRLDI